MIGGARKQYRIGVEIGPYDPFWVAAREVVCRRLAAAGVTVINSEIAESNETFHHMDPSSLADELLALRLDALISINLPTGVTYTLLDSGLPVISCSEGEVKHDFFTRPVGLYNAATIAANFLVRQMNGFGRVLIVGGVIGPGDDKGESRLRGFHDVVRPYPGMEIEHIPAYWDYERTYAQLVDELTRNPLRVESVFGLSDSLALAARDAFRKTSLARPEMLIVGINGDPQALDAIAEGSMAATVDASAERMGEVAVEMALRAVQGERLPPYFPHHASLITRENVAEVALTKLRAIANLPTQLVGVNRQQQQARLAQLETSSAINRRVGALLDRHNLAQEVAELIRTNYNYDLVQVLLYAKEQKALVLEGCQPPVKPFSVRLTEAGLLSDVLHSGQSIYINDTHHSHRFPPDPQYPETRSRVVLPVRLGEAIIGVLDMHSCRPSRSVRQELIGLQPLADQLAIAIQNADLYQEAVQARSVAEHANQLKTRLIANVGHEMRSPLNTILGFSQSISKQIDTASAVDLDLLRKDIHNIYKSGEHLMYMINDLLDLSRAEIGALNLYFEWLEPGPLISEIFSALVDSEAKIEQVRWKIDLPQELPVIRADVNRLRQILTNLLINARKYTKVGEVKLRAVVDAPYLHIEVSDTGAGIPVELQEKIFEPFGIVGRKRRPEGIGLGLSITRHLVALHGGALTLESQPGAGSTFHVYLPLPGVAQEPERTLLTTNQPVMLVISSRASIPPEIEAICARRGLTPLRASSIFELAHLLSKGLPQAVAWDMHQVTGCEWQLIQYFSERPECATLPVLLYGHAPGEQRAQAGEHCLTNILYKPCSANTLVDWLSTMAPPDSEQKTILVVDDDAEARHYYCKLLQQVQMNASIIEVENGRQALQTLATTKPDLVVLDLLMPDIDGFAVLQNIRQQTSTQHIPVIVYSGKLLTSEDIQRLNYQKTVVFSKGILNDQEIGAFLQTVDSDVTSLPAATSQLTKQVLAYLHQHYAHPVSRKDIAAAVSVSENYMSQIFRDEMRISPWDYLTRLRIERAKELLIRTDGNVTQIATQVGFNDSAYFSRVFGRLAGVSPREWRERGKREQV
jgi:signal transduction histidine kinase/ABC-type sugar transport system substrate-binding protein/AraC-like DNA-binding protein